MLSTERQKKGWAQYEIGFILDVLELINKKAVIVSSGFALECEAGPHFIANVS